MAPPPKPKPKENNNTKSILERPQANTSSKPKAWASLTTVEKTDSINRLFIETGAWKNWSEGLQKEFLKGLEGKDFAWSPATSSGKIESVGVAKDRQGRRLIDLSPEEREEYFERERELLRLKKESRDFKERGFVNRSREKYGRKEDGGTKEEERINQEEIDEEKKRRRRMAVLEGKRQSDVGVYSGDPLWDDVVPVLQGEVTGGLASIAYTEEYAEATSYLRAVMATSEHSPRVLSLTNHIISLNPAHYTVWLYRAKTLFALNSDIVLELQWLNDVALENQKNYQIWHHRQLLITHLYPSSTSTFSTTEPEREEEIESREKREKEKADLVKRETQFMSQMFTNDSKNYHVWSYRQWFIRHLSLFSLPSELAYTTTLLQQDLRNNSAYSHRFFLVFSNPAYCTPDSGPTENDPKLAEGEGKEVVQREIEWVKTWILEAPQNASSWGYLRGVLTKGGVALSDMDCFVSNFVKGVPSYWEATADEKEKDDAQGSGKDDIKSSHALEFFVDMWAEEVAKGGEKEEEAKKKALWALGLLGGKYDVIRRNYWEWRREALLS